MPINIFDQYFNFSVAKNKKLVVLYISWTLNKENDGIKKLKKVMSNVLIEKGLERF